MVLHYVSWLRYGHVLISNILIFIFLLSLSAYGQQFTIQGTVRSAEHEEPLQGATIAIEGTSITTISDAKGYFELRSPHAEGVVHIKYIGYLPQRIPFSDAHLEVFLNQDDNRVEEVQVIGYGETTRRLNTGSVSSVSAKEIEKQPVTNVLSAMSGRMPGVFVQTTNGLPGGNINIQIRGTGSIQAGTNPLYIIDGVPFDGEAINEGSMSSVRSIVGAVNPLNILNPNDIENITVLKDADATAIYGSRGSNGVVLISTRKGGLGKTMVDVGINQGVSGIADYPQLLSLEEYLELRGEAFENDGRTPSPDPMSPEYAPDLTIWDKKSDKDWYRHIYGNTANLSTVQLSISGGSANTNFRIGGNYRNEGTILRGTSTYNRGGVQSFVSHTSDNSRFKINLSSIYNIDKTDIANPANTASLMFLLPPNYPLRNEDETYNWYAGTNLEAELLSRGYSNTQNLVANLLTSYTFPIGLEIKVSGGYSRRGLNQDQVFPANSLYPGTSNYTMFSDNGTTSYIVEPQIEYRRNFQTSRLHVLVGGTYQSRTTELLLLQASNFSNEFLMRNLGSAETIDTRTNVFNEYRYVSGFGRLTYNTMDKYIFNLTARRDGSSRFGPDNRFGNFYSIGAAWLFSEENWFNNSNSIFSFGKLRASYGLTGNDQINDYQYLSTYQTRGSNVYEGISVLRPSRIFNSHFHWEVTKKLEVATELGFLNNDLMFAVNFYRNKSDNQLVNYPLPYITGFPSYQANLPAVVENTGWEFDFNAVLIKNADFQWTATANLTLPKNKLLAFENIENSSYANTHKIGEDITRIYGYSFLEVDSETGVAKFADENGDFSETPFQFHTLGKRTPDYYGGVGTQLRYKSLEFSVFGQFSSQSHMGNLTSAQFGFQAFNSYQRLIERWRNPGDVASIPKLSSTYRNDLNYFSQSDGNIFSVPYFRLKNVSLMYALPIGVTKKLGVRSVQLSVAAQNLFTLWDRSIPILDPEVGGNSGGRATIAPVKSVLFGIKVSL